jgi:transposase-like protein
MGRNIKFTEEERYRLVLDILSDKTHAEVCRSWNISSNYYYKLKDKAHEILKAGLTGSSSQPVGKVTRLERELDKLKRFAGEQALVIDILKKKDP